MGSVHVEGCEVGPSIARLVFAFDAHCATGAGRHRRMDTGDAPGCSFCVRRNDELAVAEGLALPAPLIQVEDRCGLLSEVRVAASANAIRQRRHDIRDSRLRILSLMWLSGCSMAS